VFKKWVGDYWFDFGGDPELLALAQKFIEGTIKVHQNSAAVQLQKLIMAKSAEGDGKSIKHTMTGRSAPEPIIPKVTSDRDFVVTEASPIEIARQLTLIEYNIYKKIRPSECLKQAWNKEGKEKNAPNILAMISRFNEVSNWVASEILNVHKDKKRAKTICWFIEVAERCKELNNLNALLEIVSGLNQGPVHRLKETWAAVGSKQTQVLENLNNLVSRNNNHKTLREYVALVEAPCVPYLGVYLTDLIFVSDGNPDTLRDNKLINFDKRRRLAAVIHEITQFQNTPYVLQMVPVILKYLKKLNFFDENTLYQISTHIQPRGT